jgi:pilus assembly protein CpaF
MDLPSRAIRDQITSAVDLVIQVARFKDGSRKITHITEVVGMEGDTVTLQDLFLYEVSGDGPIQTSGLKPTGVRPRFVDALTLHGATLPASLFTAGGKASR